LFLQNEYEMSCYNLDEADVADQRQRFALCEAEVGLSPTADRIAVHQQVQQNGDSSDALQAFVPHADVGHK
jgi:glycyl-tRNA synthetase alpha subunit